MFLLLQIVYNISIITYKIGRKHAKKEHKESNQEDDIEAETEAIEAKERKQNSNQPKEKEVMSRAKYNRNESENRAIADKISQLRMQGLSKERATAAAFRMFRDGELTIKIDNIRQQPKKTAEQVAIEKAVMLAAERLRKKQIAKKKREQRAEMLARQLTFKAKKEGRQLTREERILIEKTREGKR